MPQSDSSPDFSLLRTAIANLPDGFIVVDPQGHILKINAPAQRICNLLCAEKNRLPAEIWRICQSALQTQNMRSFQKTGLDADMILPELGTIRIRIQNIQLAQNPYLMVVLEDRQQTLRNKALSDAALYGLTERETEVWQLRLRGADYNEISTTLWISANTVKKHIKNILAKQRSHRDDLAFELMA